MSNNSFVINDVLMSNHNSFFFDFSKKNDVAVPDAKILDFYLLALNTELAEFGYIIDNNTLNSKLYDESGNALITADTFVAFRQELHDFVEADFIYKNT